MTDKIMLSAEMNRAFEWKKWMNEIPAISFPAHWKVRITPPLTGAVVRFRVSKDGSEGEVSVYLDCYGLLGYYGEGGTDPYWEIFPHDGDTFRCDMADIKGLISAIEESLTELVEPEGEAGG